MKQSPPGAGSWVNREPRAVAQPYLGDGASRLFKLASKAARAITQANTPAAAHLQRQHGSAQLCHGMGVARQRSQHLPWGGRGDAGKVFEAAGTHTPIGQTGMLHSRHTAQATCYTAPLPSTKQPLCGHPLDVGRHRAALPQHVAHAVRLLCCGHLGIECQGWQGQRHHLATRQIKLATSALLCSTCTCKADTLEQA